MIHRANSEMVRAAHFRASDAAEALRIAIERGCRPDVVSLFEARLELAQAYLARALSNAAQAR